jgi:hypothetical protein
MWSREQNTTGYFSVIAEVAEQTHEVFTFISADGWPPATTNKIQPWKQNGFVVEPYIAEEKVEVVIDVGINCDFTSGNNGGVVSS